MSFYSWIGGYLMLWKKEWKYLKFEKSFVKSEHKSNNVKLKKDLNFTYFLHFICMVPKIFICKTYPMARSIPFSIHPFSLFKYIVDSHKVLSTALLYLFPITCSWVRNVLHDFRLSVSTKQNTPNIKYKTANHITSCL